MFWEEPVKGMNEDKGNKEDKVDQVLEKVRRGGTPITGEWIHTGQEQ